MAHVLQGSSRMRLAMSASAVAKASTAMAVCVSLVPLGLSRTMIRVVVICAWHSARTSTAQMAYHASVAVPAVSHSPIALDVSHALLWAVLSCLWQEMRVCNVALAVSRMPKRLHASHACHRRTRSGTVRTAHRAFDARLVSSPTHSAPAAMRAWASTHRMVGNAWTALLATSHRVCPGPLAARAAVTLA